MTPPASSGRNESHVTYEPQRRLRRWYAARTAQAHRPYQCNQVQGHKSRTLSVRGISPVGREGESCRGILVDRTLRYAKDGNWPMDRRKNEASDGRRIWTPR